MIDSLKEAFNEVAQLSEDEQRHIVEIIRKEIASEKRWQALFDDPRSERVLRDLVAEALAEEACTALKPFPRDERRAALEHLRAADPVLRAHYQFWFYLYPTGAPYVETAADLRQTLTRLHAELDPEGRDPALNQMVMVGHSMGGLIVRWMLYAAQHNAPVGQNVFPPTLLVSHVDTISTPHNGTWYAWLGATTQAGQMWSASAFIRALNSPAGENPQGTGGATWTTWHRPPLRASRSRGRSGTPPSPG